MTIFIPISLEKSTSSKIFFKELKIISIGCCIALSIPIGILIVNSYKEKKLNQKINLSLENFLIKLFNEYNLQKDIYLNNTNEIKLLLDFCKNRNTNCNSKLETIFLKHFEVHLENILYDLKNSNDFTKALELNKKVSKKNLLSAIQQLIKQENNKEILNELNENYQKQPNTLLCNTEIEQTIKDLKNIFQ